MNLLDLGDTRKGLNSVESCGDQQARAFRRVSGRFADKAREAEYRIATHQGDLRRLRILLAMPILVAPLFILACLSRFGISYELTYSYLVLMAVLTLQVYILIRIRKVKNAFQMDTLALTTLSTIYIPYIFVMGLLDAPGLALAVAPIGISVIAIIAGAGQLHIISAIVVLMMSALFAVYWSSPGTDTSDIIGFGAVAVAGIFTSWLFKLENEINRRKVWIQTTELEANIKDLEEARKKAEAASNAKTSFLSNMSHEIRTPLNGVMGIAQSLEADDLAPEHKEKVATILDSGKTLMTMLNDVLDLSKIEAGKLELAPVDTDLRHCLGRVEKLWSPHAKDKGLRLTFTIDESVPELIVCDPMRIRQCVSNLVSNAIKFTHDGEVALHARATTQGEVSWDELCIEIAVTDTGIGISTEAAGHIFSAFSQASTQTSSKYGGTGLGLAIVDELAKLMGGGVSVESTVGFGSTFTLSFAARKSEQRKTSSSDHKGQKHQDTIKEAIAEKRILLVDDNPVNRQVASLLLLPYGVEIDEAENGRECLTKLAEDDYDLILLDVQMPVMDGIETIEHIRASTEAWRNVPVIALTADAMSGDREKYIAHGMNGYASKPIDVISLVKEMVEVLSGIEQIKEQLSDGHLAA